MFIRGWLCLSLLFLAACAVAPKQDALKGSVVLARYSFDVEGMESEFPQRGGGLIPRAAEAARTASDIAEAVKTLRQPEGSAYRRVADAALEEIRTVLAEHTGLRLAPVETLEGRVPYLLGYPMGDAAALARAGAAPLLAEIDVAVTVPDQETGHFAVLGSGKAHSVGHPEMILKISVFDASAELVWREQVIVRAEEAVTLDERWWLGINTERSVSDASSLPALTRRSMLALVKKSGLTRG